MSDSKTEGFRALGGAAVLSVLMAAALGIGACGSGGSFRSAFSPAASGSTPATAATTTGHPSGAAAPAPTTPQPAGASSSAAVGTGARSTTKPTAARSGPSAPPAAAAPAPIAATAAAKPTVTRAARRQFPGSEVDQVIATVNAIVPSLTPTSAQVADVGNQVCTAFDQGQTFTQVKLTALQLVGSAGSASTSSVVADSAVRTLVGMYCPGYASRLV